MEILDQPDMSKEELILNAASEVIVEKGLAGTRMQEIANRAGINKTLLHYYFRSKENIYRKIVERVFAGFFDQIETAMTSDDSFPVALRRFIDGIFAVMVANPRVPLFMMQELAQGGKTVQDILTTTLGRQRLTLPQRLFGLISREQEAGEIGPVSPFQFMVTLLGSCMYFFAAEPIVVAVIQAVRPGVPFDRLQFITERKEEIFNVLYYGIKKRKETDGR